MRTDLDTGQHRNPTGNPKYFMDTFFHHPNELRTEVAEAGFQVKNLLAIESICYMMKDFETQWKEPDKRQFLLEIISRIEAEPTLLGASPHIMCVGTKE